MRSVALVLSLVVCLAGLPSCFGSGAIATPPPSTHGDLGRTRWQLSDGFCGDGLFGNECDLSIPLAVGAAPAITIDSIGSTSLTTATLMGSAGVTFGNLTNSGSIHVNIGSSVAGVAEVSVLDGAGQVIDRVHLTFVTPTTLECGAFGTGVTHDYELHGLTRGAVSITAEAGETSASSTLACRASDASGHALLTVAAIRWNVASGSVGTVVVASDDVVSSTPAVGATARVRTSGTGTATIHATLGTIADDVAVTFH